MTRPPNKRVGRPRTTHGPVRTGGSKPDSGCKGTVKMALAFIVVGLLLLSPLHYFAPVILLAALPTKEWRRAALSSTFVTSPLPTRRCDRPLRTARAHVGAGVLRGAPAPTSNSPESRLRSNAATAG